MSAVRLLKILCEKEKLLVTTNFFFLHSVFYSFRELSAISSANPFSLEESKICHLRRGLKHLQEKKIDMSTVAEVSVTGCKT